MNRQQTRVTINRAVFTQRVFDSTALTVLTTLFHRFTKPGDYDLRVRRDDRVVHRAPVHVMTGNAAQQINIDLAPMSAAESADICNAAQGYTLLAGGVMGFYVSEGVGRYSITIQPLGPAAERFTLDSAKAVPPGDMFAVTLALPGTYTVVDAAGNGKASIAVVLPKDEPYRPDQAVSIEVGQGKMQPEKQKILAGQTVVFQCSVPARLRIELAQPVGDIPPMFERRAPHTVRRRPERPR